MTRHIAINMYLNTAPTIFNVQFVFKGVWLNKASQEEKDAANASTNLSNAITSNMNTTFANSQALQQSLGSQLQNITNQGLAGKGFLNGEEANLRSDATERQAQSNVQAEQELSARQTQQAQGGEMSSGAIGAEDATLASSAAQQNANAQRGITAKNAELARNNVSNGLQGLGTLSGQETGQADALTGAATSAAGQSFGEQTQAYQPSNFWSGLGGSVLGMGLSAVAPGLGTYFSNAINGPSSGTPGSTTGLIQAGNNQSLSEDDDLGDVSF